MSGLKVKICGIKREKDITIMNHYRPDYVGFVFAQSRRMVTGDEAAELRNKLDPMIPAVGVFVNEQPGRIVSLCRRGVIQAAQLHGDEGEGYLRKLKELLRQEGLEHIPLMKAVRVKTAEQVVMAQGLPCDMLLLDSYVPGSAYGGTGQTIDRSILPKLSAPYFLAGGLNARNLAAAVDELHPFAVDLSSGVETEGLKDEYKVREILSIVRGITY